MSSEQQHAKHQIPPIVLEHIDPHTDSLRQAWTLFDFFLIFIAQQVCSVLIFSLVTAAVPPATPDVFEAFGSLADYGILPFYVFSSANHRLYLMAISTLFSSALVIALYFYRGRVIHRSIWPKLGWICPTRNQILLWFWTFFSALLAFNVLYSQILNLLNFGRPQQTVANFFSSGQPLSLQILGIMLVLLSAPLTEELLYRGILFPALCRIASPHTAAIFSGLLFGAIHIEALTILPLAFLGYLLALSYYYTRSIWVPIALHIANNLFAYLFLLFFR
jgi:membrane protease YdiL (CAAX protease family)